MDVTYLNKVNLVGNATYTNKRLKDNKKSYSSIGSFLKETKN